MLRSDLRPFSLRFRNARVNLPVFCVLIAFLVSLPSASGQDFTLQAAKFNPFAIAPGGISISNVILSATSTVTVNLTCQVVGPSGAIPPTCAMSPNPVDAPGSASATITSSGTTTPASYTVTITGTGPMTSHSAQEDITVLAVSPQFTITVETAVAPSSVHAGSGGQGVININPINGYSGTVTLSCASVTPLVTIPPVCSFNPNPVTVNGLVVTSQLSITTFGVVPTTSATPKPGFRRPASYALWLPLPMLALAGLGAAVGGKRSRKAWGVLALLVLGGSLLLTPACGNSSTSTTTPNGITPNNSYTFTLMGVDTFGNISSNTGTTTTAPTVNLTVD